MEKWQFNVLFVVGVMGAILLFIGPEIGLDNIQKSPSAVTGVGAILTYVLTKKDSWTKEEDKKGDKKRGEEGENDGIQ